MTTYEIQLNSNNANQEFDLNIDEIENTISVLLQTTVQGALLMTVFIKDTIIGMPFLCLPNTAVVPYPYLVEQIGGNFIFDTQNDEYPNYVNFNDTCILNFVTLDEIEALVENAG